MINNKILRKILRESIDKVLKESLDDIEDVPTFEIFNSNLSLSQIDGILNSYVYDSNDNCIGRLSDLHFKYDVERNCMLGER